MPSDLRYLEASLESIRALAEAGVPVAFGTDAVAGSHGMSSSFPDKTVSGEGLFRAEIRALVRVPTNEQIVTSIKRDTAFMLGMEDEIGSLAPGMIAELVLVDGDSLADISSLFRIRLVVQSGVVVAYRH